MNFLDECPFIPGAGTINATGVIKNLNGSSLTPTEIFLRETVQNSYDAREPQRVNGKLVDSPLYYSLRAFRFTSSQYEKIQGLLFGNGLTQHLYYKKNVRPWLAPDMLNIEVTDRNTSGLVGNTEPSGVVGNQNFTNFVYFTGNDKKKDKSSGGSYGFGKAALFAFSKARTIVVYTKIRQENVFHSRFIVISSDERIDDSNCDRCWWGRKTYYSDRTRGTYAAPIMDAEADECALAIGMRPFPVGQTGTSILVLNAGPAVLPVDEYQNQKTFDQVFCEDLPRYIVHWYWNKIYEKRIEFHVEFEGKDIPLDDPSAVYPYNQFLRAYRKITESSQDSSFPGMKEIRAERPSVRLGKACVVSCPPMFAKYKSLFDVFDSKDPVVAFMRGIGHIVYYEKFSMPSSVLQTTCFGVFQADRTSCTSSGEPGEIDRYFRDIENQTHDHWEHKKDQYHFNFLRIVTMNVRDLVSGNCQTEIKPQVAQDISIVVQRMLGEKLMSYAGSYGGARKPLKDSPKGGSSSSSIRQSSITQQGNVQIAGAGYKKFISIEFRVTVKGEKKVHVFSVTPVIRTLDPNERIVDPSIIRFCQMETKTRGNMIIKTPNSNRIFTESQDVRIVLESLHDCVFDLDIDWKEE